jgi:CubicO group peptidase (beta-lactamase class C family)
VSAGSWVAPGFEPVAEAFEENFAERGELGAAFAAYVDGAPVVDLWGGIADAASGRPWERGTLQLIFSGTKGLTALCVAMLLDRGALELDAPVARWWPEFGAAGKEAVTVADVVSHRVRMPGVRTPVDEDAFLDARGMAARLAAQPQETDPRTAVVYHPITYGWLCAELVRRADPAGRSVGRFLADEVVGPLGLELWLGLPAQLEERVATLRYGPEWGLSVGREDPFPGDALWTAIWANPPLFPPGEPPPWNRRAWHAAEIPAANAIGTARSLARIYGALACGGALDGARLLSPQGVARASAQLSAGTDAFTDEPLAFGVGFELQTGAATFGPAAQAFGHTGAGGSVHGAWPAQRTGFSYAMNELRDDPEGDPRARALLAALHACVA